MDSNQLVKFSFNTWYPFNKTSIYNAPRKTGTYVIRIKNGKPFGRLKGCSDIIYIGKTEEKKGVYNRLLAYFRKPGRTNLTNIRIIELAKRYEFEVSWVISEKPSDLEMRLFNKYEEDHDELPPANRTSRNVIRDKEDLKASFYAKNY